jgi:hypothetical protein
MYPECINVFCFSILDNELSDMFHSACLIFPRELGEVWHLESWREWYLIIDRGIRYPVHARLLLGLYHMLVQ